MRRPAREINVPLLIYGVEKANFSVWRADFFSCFCKCLNLNNLQCKIVWLNSDSLGAERGCSQELLLLPPIGANRTGGVEANHGRSVGAWSERREA